MAHMAQAEILTQLGRSVLPDELWEQIELELPLPFDRRGGYVPDRAVLAGILLVLRYDLSWQTAAMVMGRMCKRTLQRRLRQWQASGAWERVERLLREQHPDIARFHWQRLRALSVPSPLPRPPLEQQYGRQQHDRCAERR